MEDEPEACGKECGEPQEINKKALLVKHNPLGAIIALIGRQR